MHDSAAYNFKVKEINTSGQLGGVKNDLCIGTRPCRPSFFYGRLYTASDKCPVKTAVWLRKTIVHVWHAQTASFLTVLLLSACYILRAIKGQNVNFY